MAKYISKENLPVFKYVNPVNMDFYKEVQNDLSAMLEYFVKILESEKLDKLYIKIDTFSEEERIHIGDLIAKCGEYYPQCFFLDGPGQQGILSKIKEYVGKMNLAKGRGFFDITQFVEKDLKVIFGLCIRMLNIITFTAVLQGKIFDECEGHVYYPKLFLITDNFFKEKTASLSMDFDDLFRLFPLENSFETFIQGNNRESKQGFHVVKTKDDEIAVFIWDRTCGCYAFSLIRKGEKSYLLAPTISCGQKKDLRRCPKWKGKGKSCVEKYADCPERRIQAAHAVLLCLQEYLVRKKRLQVTERKKVKKTAEKERIKDFQPEDMIAVFDYGENVLTKTLKFSGDGNNGIQKRPHIRAGHDRHLKNGEVVHVKGCVIHKDRYDGYLSADRIKL